jgi:RHS repeat-associated protein
MSIPSSLVACLFAFWIGPGNANAFGESEGACKAFEVESGVSVNHAPNALGQATQAVLTVNGQSLPEHRYASNAKWHPNGALASFDRGNGISHRTIQNIRGIPEWWTDTGVLQDRYLYDQNANVSAIEDWQQWVNGRNMAYDGLDRLTTANGPWGAGQYSYDALDNIRSSTVGARSLSHTYDGSNKLTGVTGSQSINFGYDANGNITNRGGQTFGFDIGNRMTRADGKANYLYDAEGHRSWTNYADGGVAGYAYGQDGKLRISGHTVHGTDWYIYLGDRLIAQYKGGNGTSYNHTDALGSPVARSNQYGTITSRTMFEAFGATASGSVPSGVGIGFTGHVNDADTGLVYMQQRYYEPLAGRFLSVDPVTTSHRNGSFFNRYKYANNNPYRFIDPDGRAPAYHGMSLSGHAAGGGAWAGASESAMGGPRGAMTVAAANEVIARRATEEVKSAARGAKNLWGIIVAAVKGEGADSAGSNVHDNRSKGQKAEDEVAADLEGAGRDVDRQVRKDTPFGPRVIDVEVKDKDGNVLGGVEVKAGNSRYRPDQRSKDEWLRQNGYPVDVVRKP